MIKTEKNIRDSYRLYKKTTDNPVDIKLYIELANNYNRFIMDKVQEGYEIVLPMRMGTLSIIGTNQEIKYDEDGNPKLPTDWQATIKLWNKNPVAKEDKRKVYHTNDHTNGVRYKYFWSKKRITVTNKNLYSLRVTREHKRAIPQMVDAGKEYYVKK